MDASQLIRRTRSITRDFTNAVFREIDIIDYINESIDRCKQVIPELRDMEYIERGSVGPDYLPDEYHHLLAVYSASRCFAQDERFHQSSTLMNEFEVKLHHLKSLVDSGELIITDPEGNAVTMSNAEYVVDSYFGRKKRTWDGDA